MNVLSEFKGFVCFRYSYFLHTHGTFGLRAALDERSEVTKMITNHPLETMNIPGDGRVMTISCLDV